MFDKIRTVYIGLESLTVYRKLLEDEVIASFSQLIKYINNNDIELVGFVNYYSKFYFKLTQRNSLSSFASYIINSIIYDDNVFSNYIEKESSKDLDTNLQKAVEHDLDSLQKVAELSAEEIKNYVINVLINDEAEKHVVKGLPEWECSERPDNAPGNEMLERFVANTSWKAAVNELISFHKQRGSGIFARYIGFVWENINGTRGLKGIDSPDPVRLSDLIGYELERKEVIENTRFFINGMRANNILLYGDRGTGKSSTVKALLNEYSHLGLRIIEVPKSYLPDLPEIIRIIKDKPQKFILFIDDLAFEDSEESYTALKAVLEGGLECRAKNTVIYATSNRRHLIKEKFSDRQGLTSNNHDDEIRAGDTIQEKLSLADRFGITVTFTLPDKNKYLEIVENLAMNRNLKVDSEWLRKEAMKWELLYNGRSPRTAQQFIDWVEGLASLGETKA